MLTCPVPVAYGKRVELTDMTMRLRREPSHT